MYLALPIESYEISEQGSVKKLVKFQFNLGHCIGYAKNLSFGIYWSLEKQSISGGPVDLQSFFLIWANPGLFLGIFIAELFNNIDFIKRLTIIGHFEMHHVDEACLCFHN